MFPGCCVGCCVSVVKKREGASSALSGGFALLSASRWGLAVLGVEEELRAIRAVAADEVMLVSWAGLASVGGPKCASLEGVRGANWAAMVGFPGFAWFAGSQDTGARGGSPLPYASHVCARRDRLGFWLIRV